MKSETPPPSPIRSDALKDLTREARTALDAIIGYAEILVEDIGNARPDAVGDLERIRSASRQVLQLVARLEQQVDSAREEAARDPLTGVANRRTLVARAEALFASDAPLSVLLIDLDRFKEINDRHGHLVGDWVLREVVARCRQAVRDSDLVARFAGDEFVLLLPGTPHTEALRVATRVNRQVSASPVSTPKGDVPVTVSVGVATRGPGDASPDALLERADRAMYAAKTGGRNQVANAEEAP